jgi:hypothetical protein
MEYSMNSCASVKAIGNKAVNKEGFMQFSSVCTYIYYYYY